MSTSLDLLRYVYMIRYIEMSASKVLVYPKCCMFRGKCFQSFGSEIQMEHVWIFTLIFNKLTSYVERKGKVCTLIIFIKRLR